MTESYYDRQTKLLYLGNGLDDTQMLDPETDQWAGRLDAPGLTLADPSTNKAFQVFDTAGSSGSRSETTIASFDLQTHNFIEAITYEPGWGGGTGPRALRFGADGLAYALTDRICLITGGFVDGRPAPIAAGSSAVATSTVSGQKVVVVDAHATDIAASPANGHLFISRGGYDRQEPNTIAEIDPVTGAIVASTAAMSNPGALSVSDDGSFLYAANLGTAAVERFSLPGPARDYHYFLGWNEPLGWDFGRSTSRWHSRPHPACRTRWPSSWHPRTSLAHPIGRDPGTE